MISNLLYALQRGFYYVGRQPQIILALITLVVIPALFLWSGQQFLEAGRENQDRIQKNKVGVIHDAFVAMARGTTDNDLVEREVLSFQELNPDIVSFRFSELIDSEIVPFIALDKSYIGVPEATSEFYQSASLQPEESLIFEFYKNGGRYWDAYRAFDIPDKGTYFIHTGHSLVVTDNIIKSNERKAYAALAIVYVVLLLITYWQIRNVDYRHLFSEAKKANETKDLFTNMIAHELRAPLTAIRGYSSMLLESNDVSKSGIKHVESIKLSSERLLSIVNDLLDVARIQSGKMAVELKEADVPSVVNSVLEELRVSASEKNISLNATGCEVGSKAYIDEKRLHQALTNLVSNSIKYTNKGNIEVELTETATVVELRIKDTGMGISAEEQKKLFAPFYRVETNDVSTITGTGLGMWITKQLLEHMHAKIAVESIKGVGTHIVLTLPKTSKNS